MSDNRQHQFFVPWFTVLFAIGLVGGVLAGTVFWEQYQAVVDDPERSERLLRFVVVSFALGPVLLAFRWFALRGRK
jgi:hypothetical protein